MCGIAGFLTASPVFKDQFSLEESLDLLAHRGPDDSGVYLEPVSGLGLAHSRLSILDLSPAGRQPMTGSDGNTVIAFNGEIYNFRELRDDLEAQGFVFNSQCDTEVLLALYQLKGDQMLPLLNGIFAFAIWDKVNKILFLARDSHGVKPLYYSCVDGRFIFASEIKSLLPMSHGAGQLDYPSLDKYLTFLWCPGEGTPFQAVRKLLPGQAMTVISGSIASTWFWYQLPTFPSSRSLQSDKESLFQATANQVRTAVCKQLVADVPVGAFLSGGLDSSAVVAFAREQVSDLRCFTIDVSGGGQEGFSDDLPYASTVATHLGVPLEVIKVDSARMASSLEQMVWQLDEPLADPAPLNVLYISCLARDLGIKVLLSGAGGDDLFTGYRRHWPYDPNLYGLGYLSNCADIFGRLQANCLRHIPFAGVFVRLFRVLTLMVMHVLFIIFAGLIVPILGLSIHPPFVLPWVTINLRTRC